MKKATCAFCGSQRPRDKALLCLGECREWFCSIQCHVLYVKRHAIAVANRAEQE